MAKVRHVVPFALGMALAPMPGLAASQPQGGTPSVVVGTVVESGTGLPVAGVTIRLIPRAGMPVTVAERGAVTDQRGRFRVERLPPGLWRLSASHVGYAPQSVDVLRVGDQPEIQLRLTLSPHVHELAGMTVTPGSFAIMGGGRGQSMTREEIESVPQFGEDIFRAVQRLPGLSSGDFGAHFSIRGGRQDETLIELDGLEIFEPYHLKDFNEGAFSIIDVETIDAVELMTGGFPARFGNKTGGVFRMTTREPTEETSGYGFGISLINARASAEGTFGDGRGSWLVSGRRGYLDLVFRLTGLSDLPSPAYTDLSSVLRYALTPTQRWSLHLLHASDAYTFNASSTTGFADSIQTTERAATRYGNTYLWTQLQSRFGSSVRLTSVASVGRVTRDRSGSESYLSSGAPQYAVEQGQGFQFAGWKQDLSWSVAGPVLLEAGYDLRTQSADYHLESLVDRNPDDPTPDPTGFFPQRETEEGSASGGVQSLHATGRVRLAQAVVADLGIRYDRIAYSGDEGWSPRMGLQVDLARGTHLRAGWGVYRQAQQIADRGLLQGGFTYHPAERLTQATVGLEHRFSDQSAIRLEVYRKRATDLRPQYRNWKGGLDVFPESNEDRILVAPDSARIHGLEVYFARPLSHRLQLSGSYAYSVVDHFLASVANVNDAAPLGFDYRSPGPQDQRHTLHVDGHYRLNERWGLSTAYAFHSGWPATTESLVPVVRDDGQPDFAVRPNRLYGDRLPAYHRLDARLTRTTRSARGEMKLWLELSNLTNHTNVFGYDAFVGLDAGGRHVLRVDEETWFPILPSVGVSWRFR